MNNESNESNPVNKEELIAFCEHQIFYHESMARVFRIAEGMVNANDPDRARLTNEAVMHEGLAKHYTRMLEELKK